MKYHALMILRRILCALSGYRVYVMDSSGTYAQHRATSYSDALGWMRCYPADCDVFVHRFGQLRAMREAL